MSKEGMPHNSISNILRISVFPECITKPTTKSCDLSLNFGILEFISNIWYQMSSYLSVSPWRENRTLSYLVARAEMRHDPNKQTIFGNWRKNNKFSDPGGLRREG